MSTLRAACDILCALSNRIPLSHYRHSFTLPSEKSSYALVLTLFSPAEDGKCHRILFTEADLDRPVTELEPAIVKLLAEICPIAHGEACTCPIVETWQPNPEIQEHDQTKNI